jgi:hypothetical protein
MLSNALEIWGVAMVRRYRWAFVIGATALGLIVARPALGVLTDLAGHWAAPLIGALEAQGIVAGDENGAFAPDEPLSRAQLAKLLVTSMGYETEAGLLSGYVSRFDDVPTWHWAKGYVESLAETAVVEGYPNGSFGPDDTVTRAQMAVVLVRLAGLSEQARLNRFEQTAYGDDAAIPDWARGYVAVARTAGLMSGFTDGTFLPEQEITRAEGAATVFRLKLSQGSALHMAGTLTQFDPVSRQGTVRDQLGQETAFVMAGNASYYRGGVATIPSQIRVLDQVAIVLGPDGSGRFMDARYSDLLGANLRVNGSAVTVTMGDGAEQPFRVQSGALVFVNGRQSTLEQVTGADLAYLVLDQATGEVRVLDAVKAPLQGQFIRYDQGKSALVIEKGDSLQEVRLASDATIVLDGRSAQPDDLMMDDHLHLALNDAGAVTYVLAER